jgi:hypothetical protein
MFLARHLEIIPAETFAGARVAFSELYRDYRPGQVIQRFLEENWNAL